MTLSRNQRARNLADPAGPLANVQVHQNPNGLWVTSIKCRQCTIGKGSQRWATSRRRNDRMGTLIDWLDHLDAKHPNEPRSELAELIGRAEAARMAQEEM